MLKFTIFIYARITSIILKNTKQAHNTYINIFTTVIILILHNYLSLAL